MGDATKIDAARDFVKSLRLKEPSNYYIYAIPADKPADAEQEWMRIVYGIEKVTDPELEDFDFFTHYNGDRIVISCGMTGAGKGGFNSRVEAINLLKAGVKTLGDSGYYKFIVDAVAKHGLSPRWEFPR